MLHAKTGFGDGFLWGGAISASQADGGWMAGGKGKNTQDCRWLDGSWTHEQIEEKHQNNPFSQAEFEAALINDGTEYYPLRRGVDFYYHYKEDIALFAELGLKLFRTSICWSRIFPHGDDPIPNREGITWYRDMLRECHRNGIKTFVTMLHYDIPVHLVTKYGGWKNRKTIDFFLRYVETIVDELGDLVDFWLPFNEFNAGRFSPWDGVCLIKDEEGDQFEQQIFQFLHHEFVANALAIKTVHERRPNTPVGGMIARFCTYPATCRPEDNLQALHDDQYANWFYTDVMARGKYPAYMARYFDKCGIAIRMKQGDEELIEKNTVDFLSFSYYFSQISTTNQNWEKTAGNLVMTNKNPYLPTSEWGWQFDPIGLRITLNQMYDRYGLPLYIAENGLGASDILTEDGHVHDDYRIDYICQHIKCLKEAIIDGVDVRGYMIWGFLDLVSCGPLTMDKRYGLIYVDRNNEGKGSSKRFRKDSFYWYQKCISTNGENLN
ncbi:family 1 glycosylhydrolase [uncultured Olegusella sp.]|uniref:family 1 glycosylhydrolase n=1 Tax=uncultured Olegusella sp. TaxID=1979846 RepID=UPI002613918E|nr:family 1 glycosylhydrolase [uncultured Olegusella sp.]